MRVLLHGEGVTDYGADNGHGGWDEGSVQIIMRKIINTLVIRCNCILPETLRKPLKTAHLRSKYSA